MNRNIPVGSRQCSTPSQWLGLPVESRQSPPFHRQSSRVCNPVCIYTRMMLDMDFWRLDAFVCRYINVIYSTNVVVRPPDETCALCVYRLKSMKRAYRRDVHTVCVPSKIVQFRVDWSERPVEPAVAIALNMNYECTTTVVDKWIS